jgi:uncharacterized membrane protein YfcA
MSGPHNPYRPPGAAVDDVLPPAGAPVKAVLYGVLIDIGGSLAGGLVLATVYSVVLASGGASMEEIQRRVSEPDPTSWVSIAGFAIGFLLSFLGGYVCARVAAVGEMRAVGLVAAASGIAGLLMGAGGYSFEWNAVLALLGMATVVAGGRVGMRKNRRRTS